MRLSKETKAVYPVPNDPDKAEATIRHMLPGEVEDTQEEMGAFETVMKKGDGDKLEPEMRQNANIGNKRYLFVVKSVAAWKNFKGEDGVDLPCDAETKVLVARAAEVKKDDGEVVSFTAWVNECRADLAKKVQEGKKAAEKN